MKNMSNCPKHGMYPSRFDSCPKCGATQSARSTPLSTEEHISSMTDTEVKYIFQSIFWENGNKVARRLCLDEYDRRFGLENWPEHISKEV